MKTADLLDSFAHAPTLSFDDILLPDDENNDLTHRLEHTILRIVASFGGDRFAHFRSEIEASLPVTADKILVHKTNIYPLPAMNIDESSTTGNADVLTEIYKNLKLDMNSPDFTKYVKIVCGDQLSISRIRSLVHNRAGHESLAGSFLWALCMPGLFHYNMAATHGVLEMHFGNQSPRNPGSLAFHNTKLDRKPIVLTSLPPFRTTRDLIFVSLYARVLHCLLLVSGKKDLDEYATTVSFDDLRGHAKAIVARYASAQAAQCLREQREEECLNKEIERQGLESEDVETLPEESGNETEKPQVGDMVYENACLFMRDALLLREFTDAIKSGDSGRVVTVLKVWTLSFRGSGRAKYAYEMLHLIHNLTHVWPAPLRKIVLQNWLVNPSGKDDAWVEVDLMQEHLNFWIKTIYKAHGSNASWEWLAMVAPCVDVLRRLATRNNAELGGRQGIKHTSPDLERDIQLLMDSLDENRVYTVEPGRIIDEGPKACVPNTKRCTMPPLLGAAYTTARPSSAVGAGPGSLEMSPQGLGDGVTGSAPDSLTGVSASRPADFVAPTMAPASLVQEADNESEEYWDLYDDFLRIDLEADREHRIPFTLDTAADVALDMDDLRTLDI